MPRRLERSADATTYAIVLAAMGAGAMDYAVVGKHVHKWYRVYGSPTQRLRRALGVRSRYIDFRALDDVSFAVTPGTAVGIVGENGAGKSTLLKIIAGTTTPTAGSVTVRGTVAAILELGAAFHPEFTGRDNAILYGAMMGLQREEMEHRLDTIFAFAELGDFVHHPVKSYSTGMMMRLAFAVATHVDPDVLVVDEALAVGDGYFQKKCVDTIQRIRDAGTTILFCSHSMYYVSLFCNRVMWLKGGRIEQEGTAAEVVTAYEEYLLNREKRRLDLATEVTATAQPSAAPAPHGQQAMITGIRVLEIDGSETATYVPGMDLAIEVDWESADAETPVHVGVAVERGDGTRVFGVATFLDGREAIIGAGSHQTRVRIHELPLAKGTYSVTAYLFDQSGLHIWDQAIRNDCLKPRTDAWAPALLSIGYTWEEL
jgi:lipopolysaccharide transport system ATP-binding protein